MTLADPGDNQPTLLSPGPVKFICRGLFNEHAVLFFSHALQKLATLIEEQITEKGELGLVHILRAFEGGLN
jgi:hypothetical protein